MRRKDVEGDDEGTGVERMKGGRKERTEGRREGIR